MTLRVHRRKALKNVDSAASELAADIVQWTGVDPSSAYLAALAHSVSAGIMTTRANLTRCIRMFPCQVALRPQQHPGENCHRSLSKRNPSVRCQNLSHWNMERNTVRDHSNPSHILGGCEHPLLQSGGTTFANVWALRCPGEAGTVGSAWPLSTAGSVSAHPAVTPTLYLGIHKHHHDTETQGNRNLVPPKSQVLPQKGLGDGKQDWVLEAALPTIDALDEAVFRNPKWDVNAPKAVRHRAKTLASLNAQGMHFNPSLGSSFQQRWMLTSAQEQMPWVEREVQEEVSPHINSIVQPEAENNPISIPKNLRKGHRALLAATKDDWERGTIRGIMCRLSLGTGFGTWLHFKRHCDTAEPHPLKIAFCDHCGDFFARSDALRRHRNKPPRECRNTKREMAEGKKRETKRVHKKYKETLESSMKTGEVVGMHFAQVIKSMYPESSKKRTGRRESS
jgi:hypothetical protein